MIVVKKKLFNAFERFLPSLVKTYAKKMALAEGVSLTRCCFGMYSESCPTSSLTPGQPRCAALGERWVFGRFCGGFYWVVGLVLFFGVFVMFWWFWVEVWGCF